MCWCLSITEFLSFCLSAQASCHHFQRLDRSRTYYRWIYVTESSIFLRRLLLMGRRPQQVSILRTENSVLYICIPYI